MRILKNIGIAIFVLITAIYALDTFLPPSNRERPVQTLTFNGKTVHLVLRGEGPISYKTETADGTLIVNGNKLDLSDGNEFTIAFMPDGKFGLRKGAP
ncbi:MAG: hypothetical protein K2Y42_05555 [Hyphomicrobium sp.]|jgi:hypothetical protein|uniref:hypothetical protein n=1 Tax=Hyphomicrobium sp. TaxID=82 RepID=UPI0025BD581F|nr:hypothetical protein [Hyphomicrobium sp.]MBX9862201.1 hypothetical protein [Hyphomicrobium sp.]